MKAVLFSVVFGFNVMASAATMCFVSESADGGDNYDTVLATKEITQDGNPVMLYQRDNDVYLALDNAEFMAIGKLVVDDAGNGSLSIMAGSNGSQVMMLSKEENLAIACVRQ